jgi:hypothetical protein
LHLITKKREREGREEEGREEGREEYNTAQFEGEGQQDFEGSQAGLLVGRYGTK